MFKKIKQFFFRDPDIKEKTQSDSAGSAVLEGPDKRRHQRVDVEICGKLTSGDNEYPVDMLDLSKSGAKLIAKNKNKIPESGQSATLILSWPLETERDDLQVEATIVRIDGNEISVQFSHIGQDKQ
ncbi:MAG: PilZ domain-containing protein [Proteobacteria bacterium]|nr:PilZ domain-containing protein [Pseudomonadota bacterium]